MVIVSDLHGVFINCKSIDELRSEIAQKLFRVGIPYQDFRRSKVVGNKWLSEEQYSEVSKEVYTNWNYVSRMRPIGGLGKFNTFVESRNIRLIIITSVVDEMVICAKRWLKIHEVNFEKIFGIGINGDRVHFLDKFQANVYIDDRLENLEKIQKLYDQTCHKFLMASHRNSKNESSASIIKVNNLENLTHELQQI